LVHSGPEPVGNHDGPRVSHRINLYRIRALIIAEIRGTDDGNLKIVVVSGLGCGHSACMGCEIARGHVFLDQSSARISGFPWPWKDVFACEIRAHQLCLTTVRLD
jgi:hypothetical protein